MREVLEATLLAQPDDLQTLAVYADWLTEQGDPRGEFIGLQLKLEDEALDGAQRDALRRREEALLEEHVRTWLGPLAEPLLEACEPPEHSWMVQGFIKFRHGFLDTISVQTLGKKLIEGLVAGQEQVLRLRTLVIQETPYFVAEAGVLAQVSFPALQVLRIVGQRARGRGIGPALAQMPALVELDCRALGAEGREIFAARLPRLKVLRVHCLHELPLDVLAANETFAGLEVLEIEPHAVEPGDGLYLDMTSLEVLIASPHLGRLRELSLRQCSAGDAGIGLLIGSPLFMQLELLDLSYGRVTDLGAQLLATRLLELPSRLKMLSLGNNRLTREGEALLLDVGIDCDVSDQALPSDGDRYLIHGSWE